LPHKNHYQLLGVENNASSDRIRAAYRKALKRYHPDANRGERNGEEMLQRALAAGRILCDPDQRAAYDRQLGSAAQSTCPNQPRVTQTAFLRSGKLLLNCRKILQQGGLLWQRFITAEWAKATEARTPRQRKTDPPAFHHYLYQAIKNSSARNYQLEKDGIYRRRETAQEKTRAKSWQKKTALWLLIGIILWRV
jgi:curved DNA-binding protein CbpA